MMVLVHSPSTGYVLCGVYNKGIKDFAGIFVIDLLIKRLISLGDLFTPKI